MGHAFRGGVADFAAYARISLDDLARLVELARTANPKATIGLSLYVATGNGLTVDSKWSPSEGFEIKAGWTTASNDGGFLLLDVVNVEALVHFSSQFKDLNDTLDITPVVELGDGVAIAMKAYEWIDSVSG